MAKRSIKGWLVESRSPRYGRVIDDHESITWSRPPKTGERVSTYLVVLQSLGHELRAGDTILDFGCGNGRMVQSLLEAGISACGCDLSFPMHTCTGALLQQGVLSKIREHPYRLPYPDACFDAVISDQVLEHVLDYETAVDEIYRVLKPGGVTLHVFPSKLSIVEVHSRVPVAGFFRPYWWLSLWAHLGIRMPYQLNMEATHAARSTYAWLHQNTNYHNRNEIRGAFCRRFRKVSFCEREVLLQNRRLRHVPRLILTLPAVPVAYSAFRSRALFAEK